jgi:hypothetical protein
MIKEKSMKKTALIFVTFALFAFTSGCDVIKDAADVEFIVSRNHIFTIDANLTTYPRYDVDLNEDEDYRKYRGKIRDVEILYLRYAITSNTGSGGKSDFYANSFGGSFATATKVAETISFAAGETRGATDVTWLNKDYIENLLIIGRLSVWAVAEGTNVRLTVPVELRVKITANPLE